jgi:hypothetical protein
MYNYRVGKFVQPCKEEKYVLRVIDFARKIEVERKRDPELVYTAGDCGNLHSHLKLVFNCAKPLLRNDHVRTQIEKHESNKRGAITTKKIICDVYGLGKAHGKDEIIDEKQVEELFSNNYQINCLDKVPSKAKGDKLEQAEKRLMDATAKKVLEYIETEEFLK